MKFAKLDQEQRRQFAERFANACDNHPHVPPKFRGRSTWLRDELTKRHGLDVTLESISRWFAGEAKPRGSTMAMIAELLGVDVAWLSLGSTPNVPQRERRLRSAMVDGAVNLVAGLIQLDGGTLAFPKEGESSAIDLYAIIKGANYAFHVSLGEALANEQLRFTVPAQAEELFKIGVIRGDGFNVRLFELPTEVFGKEGARWIGSMTADTAWDALGQHEITSFSRRL